MVGQYVLLMVILLLIQRMVELYIAKKNRKWALESGAQEFGKEHYPWFFILHGGWLLGWVLEVSLYERNLSELWFLWLSLFIIAQGIRYWCIVSLGRFWNTRILVIPGRPLVSKGPYKFIKHPNYVAVAIELIAVPLLFDAVITAGTATVLNGWLLLNVRIPAEERALQ